MKGVFKISCNYSERIHKGYSVRMDPVYLLERYPLKVHKILMYLLSHEKMTKVCAKTNCFLYTEKCTGFSTGFTTGFTTGSDPETGTEIFFVLFSKKLFFR